MRNRSVVSIDLGSAYTKVAVRRDWHEDSELLRDLPLAAPEVSFCIPSVVARVEAPGGVEWLVGAPAAAQHPAGGVRIFRYWKARLFGADSGAQAHHDHMGGSVRSFGREVYEEVAVQFFRGLKEIVHQHSPALDLGTTAVRVCVPKLDPDRGVETRVSGLLERAGLRPAQGRAVAYEPESNACGVLTRGRNVTWFPPRVNFMPTPGRSLHLREMLDSQGLLQAFRRVSGSFGVLVIDIGGFTTDFGYVEFDTSFASADWQRPRIVQQSYELGIRELDQAIYEGMTPEAQEAVRGLTSGEWDARKARLFRGEAVRMQASGGGVVQAGAGAEAERNAAMIREFGRRVNHARQHFLDSFVTGPLNAQTLTGGGAMIPLIREVVADPPSRAAPVEVYDLFDEDEPRRTLSLREARLCERAVAARAVRNRELVRGGSAIGGSSVFFE